MFALPFFRSLRDALLTLWTSIESYGWKYVYNLGRFRTPSARQNADSYMNFAIGELSVPILDTRSLTDLF